MNYKFFFFNLQTFIVNGEDSLKDKLLYLFSNGDCLAHDLGQDLVNSVCIGSLLTSRDHRLGFRNGRSTRLNRLVIRELGC